VIWASIAQERKSERIEDRRAEVQGDKKNIRNSGCDIDFSRKSERRNTKGERQEARAGKKEQRAEIRQQTADSREQRAESREQRADSRQQTENRSTSRRTAAKIRNNAPGGACAYTMCAYVCD
jgi:hypothetical protein